MKKPKLVTRESLRELVAKDAAKVVARALIVIYERQTSDEQSASVTKVRNGVGFSGADAELGTRCAKAALAGKLEPWMLKIWSSVTSTGFPKICKYARQLNEIAEAKQHTKGTILEATAKKAGYKVEQLKLNDETDIMDFYGVPNVILEGGATYENRGLHSYVEQAGDLPYEMYRELQLGTGKITTS